MAGSLQVDSITNSAGTGPVSFPQGITNSVAPNYFQGYFPQNTTWTCASSSFLDPTLSAGSATLTTVNSHGMTVTAASSNILGVTWTPSASTAIYSVFVNLMMSGSVGNAVATIRLTDGTNVAGQSFMQSPVSDGYTTTMSGLYLPNTSSAITLKIQAFNNSGTLSLWGAQQSGSTYGITFTVVQIF